jgi:aspartate aminotransferase
MRISERVRRIAPSLTLAVSAKAAKLKAQGVDVIGFGAGEPDFDTPDHIKRAVVEAMARGASKYTAVAGTPELRRAVADELNAAHGIQLGPEEVIVSCGAKHSLFNLFTALCDDGDEVIVPSPCWVSYPELVAMAGGKPVILETRADEGFRLDERRLAALVSPRTRAIVLCSPSNPTGALYDAATLEAVARVIADRGGPETFVITDDIYRRLVYRGAWASMCRVAPKLAARTILVDGVSKSYAMTGWRIGYCAGPRDLVAAMATLQGQSTTNAAAVSQAAALAALTGPQEPVEEMRREFDRRRQAMVAGLRAIPGVKLHEPAGAFYAFPDLSAYTGAPGKPADDVALAEYLLEKARVAVVPGSGFLAPGFARLSYATSMKNVEEGVRRIGAALAELG